MINKLTIKSILKISTFTGSNVDIHLKQGTYTHLIETEELTLISESELFDPNMVVWEYFGDKNYATIASDFPFIIIRDRKTNDPELNEEWIEDNVENFYSYENSFIFEIPCGNAGALSIYVTKNEKGHIIGVKFNAVHPDDM